MLSGASTALPIRWLWQKANEEASKLSPGPRQVLPSSQRWGAQREKGADSAEQKQPPRMIPQAIDSEMFSADNNKLPGWAEAQQP